MSDPHDVPAWHALYWHRRRLRECVEAGAREIGARSAARFAGETIRVLDVGCGTVPYRALFEGALDGCEYVGAEVVLEPGGAATVAIDANTQRIDLPDASVHAVVHFQVMEHVPDAGAFLAECHRVLKPGGTMFATVPFAYEFHAVPSDYRRWTHVGLAHDVTAAGFTVDDVSRVERDLESLATLAGLQVTQRAGRTASRLFCLAANTLARWPTPPVTNGLPLTHRVLATKG